MATRPALENGRPFDRLRNLRETQGVFVPHGLLNREELRLLWDFLAQHAASIRPHRALRKRAQLQSELLCRRPCFPNRHHSVRKTPRKGLTSCCAERACRSAPAQKVPPAPHNTATHAVESRSNATKESNKARAAGPLTAFFLVGRSMMTVQTRLQGLTSTRTPLIK